MPKFLIYAFAGIAGFVLGPMTVFPFFGLSSPIEINGWKSNWTIGSEQANPYLRAYVAVYGLLALTKEEAVYFTTSVDADGNTLTETCQYEMTGADQPSRWWSITLYDKTGYLPMNEDGALSMDATRANGTPWRVIISPDAPDGENAVWVSSKNSETFDLTLRLYEPSEDLLGDPEGELNAPIIRKLSCAEGAA